jgi:hypothetical protein
MRKPFIIDQIFNENMIFLLLHNVTYFALFPHHLSLSGVQEKDPHQRLQSVSVFYEILIYDKGNSHMIKGYIP